MMKKIFRYVLPVVFVLVAFFAGLFLGRGSHPRRGFGYEQRHEMRDHFMRRLSDDLDLSSEQEAQISSILKEQRHNFRRLQKELRPQFRMMHEQTLDEISAILDEDQKSKFETIKKRLPPPRDRKGPRGRD